MTTFQEAFEAADSELESTEVLDGSPADGGQAEGEDTGEVTAPEQSYFDIEAHGDQLVKIKVDGVEQSVPLRELPNGYMRQEAFTQKTQALAADRQRLSAAETLALAYERNPHETVRFLAQQQGLTLAEAQAQAEAATQEQEDGWTNDTYVDPRMTQLDSRLANIEAREARMDLERNITHLGTVYGADFDATEVIAKAIEYGTTDLEGVYKQIAFDRVFSRSQAEAQVATQRAATEASTTAAKQQLATIVSSGESFLGGGTTGSAPITTVAQALEAALAGSDFNF